MFTSVRPRMAVTGDHGGHASSRRSRAAETSGAVQSSKEEGRLRGVDPAAPPQPVRVNGEAGGTPPPTHAFGGLVHQQHRRLDRQQPGDAQLLLLLQRQLGGLAVVQAVLDLVPQQHLAQRLLDDLVLARARAPAAAPALAVQVVAEDHVVADRDRQRVGALEDHADLLAHLDQLDVGVVDVLAQHLDRALDAHVAEPLVDAVDAAQQSGLAAARRADQRGDDALA